MKLKRVNGEVLEGMLTNAWNYLKIKEQEINKINVFPVPDGDTGSNMRLTLENGLKVAVKNNHAGEYLKTLARGMLYGARGNSGVILSQIFYGFSKELERDSIIDAHEFVEGFISAYKCAYKAMVSPKEGTILTVARESIESIKECVSRGTYIDVFFSIYLAEIKKSLENTPNLLPVLKQAGVVDSGGMGYAVIIEGMLKYLQNEIIQADVNTNLLTTNNNQNIDNNLNLESNLKFGYCTEFILHLIKERQSFKETLFIEELQNFGDSIACVVNDQDVKVHIHTKKPGDVINYAQSFGEFISFKIENMDLQNEHHDEELRKPVKELVIIAVAQGEALKQTYFDLGCDVVIDGGNTMNTSCEEIVNVIKANPAKKYVIIVNNKNIILSAEQACKVLDLSNITIIKTNNILEGYYVLAGDDSLNNNIDLRIKNMVDTTHALKTIEYFNAVRDCTINGVEVYDGDYTSISDDVILSSSRSLIKTLMDSLKKIPNIENYSTCMILKGSLFDDSDEDEIIDLINSEYDNLEVVFMDGGQPLISLIIGLI